MLSFYFPTQNLLSEIEHIICKYESVNISVIILMLT